MTARVKTYLLLALSTLLDGCYSTYIQPTKSDTVQIRIINDSKEMSIFLNTYEDGSTCKGLQFFNLPKEMLVPNANSNSHMKVGGEFSTLIDAEKPFSLEFDGIKGASACVIHTTLIPDRNSDYEYHFNYLKASNLCTVYVIAVTKENIKTAVGPPKFRSRERMASAFNGGSSCK